MSHRGPRFAELYAETTRNLQRLLDIPSNYHIWFMGSATEAMERSIQNTVRSHSHHIIAGSFGQKFADQARGLDKLVTTTQSEWGSAPDLATAEVPGDAELIAIVQNDTSSGTLISPQSIDQLHERYPDKLIAVDIVSSAPYATLNFASADLVLFSVQKGFGLPAGLGVLVASPRALERSLELQATGLPIGNFHSFPELARYAAKGQTPETPNILGIYLLNAVAGDIYNYGLPRLRQELEAQAVEIYRYFDEHPTYSPIVPEHAHRSVTTLVISTPNGSRPVMDALSAKGLQIGSGYGKHRDAHIRIANFPAHLGHTQHLLHLLEEHSPANTDHR